MGFKLRDKGEDIQIYFDTVHEIIADQISLDNYIESSRGKETSIVEDGVLITEYPTINLENKYEYSSH